MHLKRWLTGIVAVPLLIFLIGPGPRLLFHLLLYAASLVGIMEFYRMTAPRLPGFVRYAGYLLTLLLFLVISMRQVMLLPLVISLMVFVPMTFYMIARPAADQESTAEMAKAFLGPIYVGLPLAMLVLIDLYPSGNLWIFFLLTVVFCGDTGAFYVGRRFGRHKLYEAISPNKTWEGALGGLLGSLLGALIFMRLLALRPIDPPLLVLVLTLSASEQIGDLAASALKRNHGIKDTGHILPGHGGILDRIDGLLFAIPLLFTYLSCYAL